MNCLDLRRSKFSKPHIPPHKSLNSRSLQNWLKAPPVPTPLRMKASERGAAASSAPAPNTSPSMDVGSMNVLATKTPPGRNTRDISATAADGEGQQCIAAPA